MGKVGMAEKEDYREECQRRGVSERRASETFTNNNNFLGAQIFTK